MDLAEATRAAASGDRRGKRRAARRAQASAKCRPRDRTVIRMPSYEQVASDPVLYAHASRILHLESNPGNARALVQRHGTATSGSTRRRCR